MAEQSPEDRDQKIRQTYTIATQALRDAYPKEFNALRVKAAKDLGVEWQPRPSKEQKAEAELDRLLEENPDLLTKLAQRVAETEKGGKGDGQEGK